mmetsp:Transcript_39745/g.69083  ORF Transcript_39745/g.69083 Transcript_39745/m.69083 type:complete len:93 (+) Transcript_39745:1199-1477(+)
MSVIGTHTDQNVSFELRTSSIMVFFMQSSITCEINGKQILNCARFGMLNFFCSLDVSVVLMGDPWHRKQSLQCFFNIEAPAKNLRIECSSFH